jgi:MYXO-CTERM domain-containing protein
VSRARLGVLVAVTLAAACGSEPPAGRNRADIGSVEEEAKVCAGANLVEGIDVSHYQPNVDWAAVKAAGREFAFIKASEGTGYTDPSFAGHWANSKAAGLLRGAYHFHRVDSDPIAQADHFLSVVGALGPGDMIMLDVEDAAHGGTPSSITANVQACIDHIAQKAGKLPVLYTGMWYWTGHMGTPTGFSKYPMFIAAYPSAYSSFTSKSYCPTIPDDFSKWAFWQYSDGSPSVTAGIPPMPGVGQSCDRDVFQGTLAELMAFAGGGGGADWAATFVKQSWPYASAAPIQMTVGQTLTGSIDLKNTGTKTWPAGVVRLAPIPHDKASDLAAGSWLSPTRVSSVAADVKPGETGHFEWDLTASKTGDFMPYFGLVAEGIAWFADSGGPADNVLQVNVHVAAAPPMGGMGGMGAAGTGAGGGPAGKAGSGVAGSAGSGAKAGAGGASVGAGGKGGGQVGPAGSGAGGGAAGATTGAGGAEAGAGTTGAAGYAVVNQDSPTGGGGCGCRVDGASTPAVPWAGVLGIGLAVLRRRRRANHS